MNTPKTTSALLDKLLAPYKIKEKDTTLTIFEGETYVDPYYEMLIKEILTKPYTVALKDNNYFF